MNVVTVADCSPALSARSAGGKAIACQLMEHRYRLETSGRHLIIRDPIDQSEGGAEANPGDDQVLTVVTEK